MANCHNNYNYHNNYNIYKRLLACHILFVRLFLEVAPFCISLQLHVFITTFMVNSSQLSESPLTQWIVASGFLDK